MTEEKMYIVKGTKTTALKKGMERERTSEPMSLSEATQEKAKLSREGYEVTVEEVEE